MKNQVWFVAAIVGFAVPITAFAKEKWTADDVVNADAASNFEISPDGRWAVWVKSVMDKDKGERLSQLMRTSLTEAQEIELTRGNDSCHSPRWSPDGKLIAFLSARPAPKSSDKRARRPARDDKSDGPKTQLWLINPFGGEGWRLTDYSRDISAFDWAGNDRLTFVAQEEKSLYEAATDDEKKDTSRVVEDEKHEPPARLFQVDVKTKKIKRLTDNVDRIDLVAVSPDGKWAVTRHGRSLSFEYDGKTKPVLFLNDLTGGGRKQVFADKRFNISAIRWRPDSAGFFAVNDFCSNPEFTYPSVTQVHEFDLTTAKEAPVELGWDNGLATQDVNGGEPGLVPIPGGFLALLADGARNKLARYKRAGAGWQRDWIDGDDAAHVFGFAARDGKALAYSYSTASKPAEWRLAPLEGNRLGEPKTLTTLNDKFANYPIAKSEVIRWKGALDEAVEGILYFPHDFEKGKRYPLVVMIHGGPEAADQDCWDESWAYAANLYCQRNAFVLKPNYHGSGNYGLKWAESIAHGRYYELEAPDIEKGVDHLIDRGLVDPDKLGVLGWSNGAILAIELTVRSTRFKAAASGAGDVDWVSDWANCDFGDAFDRAYLGKTPLQDLTLYIKKSPFYRLDKVRTPTLIFFGTEDRSVATEQGWMHFRALQQLGKTPVRFILFPGEKHSPKKLVHQRRKLEEELAWFDKYLFKTTKEENEALKEGSPLARVLKLQDAARTKGIYGNDVFGSAVKEQIIPETVEHAGMIVGRFEVTRAQFHCFDPKYRVGKGAEDYPATQVTFEEAQRYCEWLSKLTGTPYRLPTAAEGDELYGSAESGENTLDFWAGYAVNPDDAQRLREKIERLNTNSRLFELTGTKAPLLRPVGQFKAVGDASVFDLGGNAAEWVTTADGKGKLMGGSADQPADAKALSDKAALEYRGFRVVHEQK
jgi:dipeptidyl aminopeptidase/acylaminoacyl peptidase